MTIRDRLRTPIGGTMNAANGLSMAMPLCLLLGAVLFERIGGLVACEMCMMQRWPLVAAAALSSIALFMRSERARRVTIMSAGFAILTSAAIAVDHLGIERKWWEGHTACTSSLPKDLSSADFLKAMMDMPLIRCDTAQWSMLGLSLADINAIVSGSTGIAVIYLVLRAGRRCGMIAADAA